MSARHSSRPAFGRRFDDGEDAQQGGVTLRRGAMIGIGAGAFALAAWAGIATWCLLQTDALSEGFLARHTATERAYEERIGALRTRLDRVTSHKLIEQQGFDALLAKIAERQRELESRQTALARLIDQSGPMPAAGESRPQPANNAAEPPRTPRPLAASGPKPAPVVDGFELRTGSGGAAPPAEPGPNASETRGERLSGINRSLRTVEAAQLRLLDGIRRRSDSEVSRLRAVIASLGLRADRLEVPQAQAGMGGPYVPVPPHRDSTPFESTAAEAQKSLSELARLRHASAALPLGRPAAGEAELTSGFGMRIDPFTRGPAMHTGLDFRADHGAEVRATAAGRVLSAEYSGGYGRMVEVDHGNGVTTRYAHLSSMRVAPGETVAAGTVVGRVGSTGRSTGAHLHYETRIDGEPVDPQRFLRAGARLGVPSWSRWRKARWTEAYRRGAANRCPRPRPRRRRRAARAPPP